MAEDPAREERRKKLYSNDRSKRARGEDAEPKKEPGPAAEKPEGHADPSAADNAHLDVTKVLGRHGEEREALRVAHEGELRAEHMHRREELRSMNKRHEDEHKGMAA
jgi:hypothetical protein